MNATMNEVERPSDDEILSEVLRRMTRVEAEVPQPRPWRGDPASEGDTVRPSVRSRVRFAGFAPLVLVVAIVATAVGFGLAAQTGRSGPAGAPGSAYTLTITYRLIPPDGQQVTDADLENAVAVMQARVGESGALGVGVAKLPPDMVEVQVIGVTDETRLLSLLGQTGVTELVALPGESYGTVASPGPSPLPQPGDTVDPALGDRLSLSRFNAAGWATSVNATRPQISLQARESDTATIATWAQQHADDNILISVDGKVMAVAHITEGFTGGNLYIDGGTPAELNTLVPVLQYGELLPHEVISRTLTPILVVPGDKVVSDDGSGGSFGIPTPMPATPSWTLTPATPNSGRTLGNADAPVTVDVWSDFRCGPCASFMADQERQLIDNYVNLGKVRIVYHDQIVVDQGDGGHDSLDAAVAARIAGDQGKFWEYAGWLFANQQNEQTGAFRRDVLISLAHSAGLNVDQFTADFDAGKHVSEVRTESASGQAAGLIGTPSVLVNGHACTTIDYPTIALAVESALASARP